MSKKCWIFLLSFIFLTGLGCSTKSSQTTGPQGNDNQVRLSGKVNTNGARQDGILVTAINLDYTPGSVAGSYTTHTNSEGAYSMSLPAGVYNVVAEGQNSQKAVRSKVRLLDPTTLDFVLTATGGLAGKITYRQSPQEGIIAFLYGTQFMSTTDQNGNFKISGIPIGTYQIGIIVPDEGNGRPIRLTDSISIEAGNTKDMGTIEGAKIEHFAFIDYVDPGEIEHSNDPNHPVVIHRYELFDDCSRPGLLVKFERGMDPNSVKNAIQIDSPSDFAARGLRWKFEWGYYSYKDYRNDFMDNYDYYNDYLARKKNRRRSLASAGTSSDNQYDQMDTGDGEWVFVPSPCHLTLTPRDEHGQLAYLQMPVGKYTLRLAATAKDTCGNPLYRAQIYSFEIREMMRWAANNHFLPNGATGIEPVGDNIVAEFTNTIDQSSVDFDTDLTITPALQGKEVFWAGEDGLVIHGLYAEGTTYTIELDPNIKTIYGDPFVNTNPTTHKFTVQFTTAAPRVAYMFPNKGSKEFNLEEPVILAFNTITDRDSVAGQIHVYDDTNNVEIPAYVDANITPCHWYKLAWLPPKDDNYYSDPCYNDYGSSEDEKCENCGLGSKCDQGTCCQDLGDHLSIFFPRQYARKYRVELDGNAVSFRGGKIAAFSGSFQTKVPRLVEANIRDGETIDNNLHDLYFRYNVDIDISGATFTLLDTSTTIPLDVKTLPGGELHLMPTELPSSSHFVLTLNDLKAKNGYPIPDETFNFSTQGLAVVDSDPYNGELGYDYEQHQVTIWFNGQLTDAMKQAIEQKTQVIGSAYYGPEVDGNSVPDNYTEPSFFWCNWKFGWTKLQIAFTMDPCTNYKIHCETDPTTGAVTYDDDQDPTTSEVPFFWLNRDLIFTTDGCEYEEMGSQLPPLVYRTDPPDRATDVSLDHTCFTIYVAIPPNYDQPDIEVLANGNPIYFDVSYPTSNYGCPQGHMDPWGWTCDGLWRNTSWFNVCLDHLEPSTQYRVTVKGGIDLNYDDPADYNLPYTFSFTTEPTKIFVDADNNVGIMKFYTNAGYFKLSDLQDQNILELQPELRDSNSQWQVFRDQNEVTEYGNKAELHYQPIQYSLIKSHILKALDCFVPDPTGTFTLIGTFANTPQKQDCVLKVDADITLPKLEKVEHEPGQYDLMRLFFNVPVDSATALDANNYTITYVDGNTKELGIQGVWDYYCYLEEGTTDNCDPAYGPPVLGNEGQVLLRTDPQQDMVEYTLQVTGVKEYGQRYVILPEDGQAKFQGIKYHGRVDDIYIMETIHDIHDVFDQSNNRDQWKSRARKIAIHFDVPMDPNKAKIGNQIEVTPSASFDQDWYNSNTTTVITYYYAVTPGDTNSYPPDYYDIHISDECRNADGRNLEDTPRDFTSIAVDKNYFLDPEFTAYLDPNHDYPADPNKPIIKLNFSYYDITSAAVIMPSSYRLVDPNNINTSDDRVLDPNGNPVTITTPVDNSNWPYCLLKLSGYPASSIPRVLLVYSDIRPAWLPDWFPTAALKDVGYTKIDK